MKKYRVIKSPSMDGSFYYTPQVKGCFYWRSLTPNTVFEHWVDAENIVRKQKRVDETPITVVYEL